MADFGEGPSRSAVLTAVARSVHREEAPPWMLDDYLALDLADVEGLALRERLRAEVPPALLLAFGRWTCVRARLAEDVVERSISDGLPST
jgi:O-methyltransferase involved in polyketide biosynthesis